MKPMLFGSLLALAIVATMESPLDLPSNVECIDLRNGNEVPVLCEIPSNPPPVELVCPGSFFSLGDSCYGVFDNQTMSWDNAQTFCGSLAAGGRLVELETEEELALVKRHLLESDYYCSAYSWYWIGGEEIGDSNTFKWASTGQMINDSDWYPGQPNGSDSGDAILLFCGANWMWFDLIKSDTILFICEAPPVEI
ncbi:unnamed protein product [Cyprideis torosa]|uniref:Uncharacterized protein n=1 Tax=Cyprideis torosa TaxID=163714 RepID=A0A7R8WD75_9CRUS|nr:unnamed protein product [Cyprideis torosa]CAG0892851.1 unnamed protein product [Cyprideis torosa]